MAKTICGVSLFLILSLLGSICLHAPALASPEVVKWVRVNIPTEGQAGKWVLASGSDVQHPTLAIDGTLYAYGKGLSFTLYKSTDGGFSWSPCGRVTDAIVGIATSPDDASIIYYATATSVYKSIDAANNFTRLVGNPGGAGSNNVEITSIDVARLDSHHIIAVGTRDTDNAEYGGVYIFDESIPFSDWLDTGVGNYDVYALAFSPDFAIVRQLLAVVTDETDTFLTAMDNFGWGNSMGDAKLDKDNSGVPTPVVVQDRAEISFPSNYNSSPGSGRCALFVAIDTGTGDGDIYNICGVEAPTSSVAIDLNIGSCCGLSNVDVTSLAAIGNAATANILAGAASSSHVYHSSDGGSSWTRSIKPPTGQSETYVLLAADFLTSGLIYTATTGNGSAFSYSVDTGLSFNQISLIDAAINTIVDLAFSLNFAQDGTLFMLTFGAEESLWRSLDDGATWERILTRTLAGANSISLVECSPQGSVLFIAGSSGASPAVWKSSDNGQTFASPCPARDPVSGASIPIDAWALAGENSLFIGSFDGSNGLVYRSSNDGLTYFVGAVAGNQSLNSIVLSPNYEQDKTILVGNTNGGIYYSNDNGSSFEVLPPDATSPPLSGNVIVAFDSRFSQNKTVYASSDTADEGIYRFIIGSSPSWESIDSLLPTGSMLSGLEVSTEGVLYAANFKADQGMERSLNPTYQLGPTFESVVRGLDDGAILSGLWLKNNRLWSIDSANIKLMTFIDSLTQPVNLTSPADRVSGVGTIINYTIGDVSLDWEGLEGATGYQWQFDYDTDFSTVPTGFEGTTRATQAKLPQLQPVTTYHWRVRASSPVLSPWSEKWSFTTSLGTEVVALELKSPEAGASGVPLKPLFQWSAVVGAEVYELLVSTDPGFSNPLILKAGDYALPGTAWQCSLALDYDTTYYWEVRALGSGTYSAWSATGAFTTISPPGSSSPPILIPSPQPLTPPSPPPSTLPTQEVTPDWFPYIIGGQFFIMILLIVVILVLALRRA